MLRPLFVKITWPTVQIIIKLHVLICKCKPANRTAGFSGFILAAKTGGAEEIMLAAGGAEVRSEDLWRKEGSEGGDVM